MYMEQNYTLMENTELDSSTYRENIQGPISVSSQEQAQTMLRQSQARLLK